MIITTSMMSIILTIIGIAVSVISIVVGKKKKPILEIVAIGLITLCSIIFINNYDFKSEDNLKSREEIISLGIKNVEAEDYIDAAYYFSLEKVDTDPVALNNLAHLYENGLGISKDLDLASDYYHKAANLHNLEAEKNNIAFIIQHPKTYEEVISCLRKGYSIEDPSTMEFLSFYAFLLGYDKDAEDDKALAKIIMDLSDDEIIELLDKNTYTEAIPLDYYSGVSNSQFVSIDKQPRKKIISTEAYEESANGGKKTRTPITVTVDSITNIVHEKKLWKNELFKTSFIYEE